MHPSGFNPHGSSCAKYPASAIAWHGQARLERPDPSGVVAVE